MAGANLELGPGGLLPPGEHTADMATIRSAFGITPHRAAMLDALELKLHPELAALGFDGDYILDGSFVSIKPVPDDLDIILQCYGLTDEVFTPLARLVIARHLFWKKNWRLDVHPLHPRIPRDHAGRDILDTFRAVREIYRVDYNVPASVETKGLITWSP